MSASLTVVNTLGPWLAHMISVAAVSYVLSRRTRLKLVSGMFGCALSVAVMFGFSFFWFDARFYWRDIERALLGGLARDLPYDPGTFAMTWGVPVLVAWGCTCWACPRLPIRPTDGSTD